MKSRYRLIFNELPQEIIRVLSLTAQDSRYDFVLLAVRFQSGRREITEFIIGKHDWQIVQLAILERMLARGGEPMGFVHVRLRRPDEDELSPQLSINFEHIFSHYRVMPLPNAGSTSGRKYLSGLTAECALALHAAGLIRLAAPE